MFKNREIIMNLINLIIKEWGIKHTFYVIINKSIKIKMNPFSKGNDTERVVLILLS